MAADLAIVFTEHGDFDLALEGGDLLGDEELQTPITISLFSDRVARADDPLPEYLPGQSSDRRGWWGDMLREDGRAAPIGSRLWLLFREKIMREVPARAQEYAAESLGWLRALGGAASVTAYHGGGSLLVIEVEAVRSGPASRSARWTAFLDYSGPRLIEFKR